ncbi:MAG: ABC transporter permease [Candidatus Micrarchaeaceae archaeon]
MNFLSDTFTLYKREMLIFKSNLKTNIIRSIIFPLVLIFILGSMNESVSNINVAIVNYANNPQSFAFINSLTAGKTLSIAAETTQTVALNMLSNGSVSAAIVILPQFPAQSKGAPSVDVYYSNANLADVAAIMPNIEEDAQSMGGSVLKVERPAAIASRPMYGTESNYKVFLIAGVVTMIVVFGSMFGGGMSLITDKQLGILKSFFITPASKASIVMGKVLSGSTQAMLYVIIALIIGMLDGATVMMGWAGVAWILALSLLLAMGFNGITIMLASRISKVEIYSILGNVIVMPLWFLSGAFMPISSLPSFLSAISPYDPMTYATQGIRDVMMLGYYPTGQIVMDVSALVIFVIASLTIGLMLFKDKID